jgi:tRNA (guanine37-N1)-methyltransferase
MPSTRPCLRAPKTQGEKLIALASKLGFIDKSLAFHRDFETICIPLARQISEAELEVLREKIPKLELKKAIFTEKKQAQITLSQALQNQLPSNLLERVPQAFDIIGDIVVIDIPTELKQYQKVIGEAILRSKKTIKTVLAKASDINGTFRVRDYTLIAGEDKTETIHKEFGCRYYLDLAKAYFSPRLSYEHERVASLVSKGEVIVDLFAGVGPFSILIAKKQSSAEVYAVDLNPEAVEFLKLNVRFNRVENRVFPILGEAKEIARTKLRGVADRVIMNLPETAIDFVDAACDAIKLTGGIFHFYGFVRSPDTIDKLKNRFLNAVERNGRIVESFLFAKRVRETAPYESQIVLDAKIGLSKDLNIND